MDLIVKNSFKKFSGPRGEFCLEWLSQIHTGEEKLWELSQIPTRN